MWSQHTNTISKYTSCWHWKRREEGRKATTEYKTQKANQWAANNWSVQIAFWSKFYARCQRKYKRMLRQNSALKELTSIKGSVLCTKNDPLSCLGSSKLRGESHLFNLILLLCFCLTNSLSCLYGTFLIFHCFPL